jgi:hypothetical protein
MVVEKEDYYQLAYDEKGRLKEEYMATKKKKTKKKKIKSKKKKRK